MADADQTVVARTPLTQLPPAARQVLLLVGLAGAVAGGVALVLWAQSPNYTLLYSGLADRDAAEVVALLEGSAIPYKLDPTTGGVMVPADRKYEVRMAMATAGLPRGNGFGVDEMPERGSFGQSPFMENALYVHAVETELSRTVSSLQPVEMARVHLAVPPQSVFVRRQRKPSASVMLKLFPGRRLEQAQVQAVMHLVASSVPELSPEQVTIVDQRGALLTKPQGDETSGLTSTQFGLTKSLEEAYAARIEDLLTPMVGEGRVRATVAAELDFTVSEETTQSFDPESAALISETTDQSTQVGQPAAQGIPGALSNQPPSEEAATGQTETQAEPVSTTVHAVRNFEVDNTISHVKQAVGDIQRLSIGVLIDHKPSSDGRGPGEPLAQEELDSLTELVRQAVGFDEARGDTISVLNAAFQPPPPLEAVEPPPLWERPMIWNVARQILGAVLVLVLALVIVRPIMRSLTTPQPILPPPGELGAAGVVVGEHSIPGALPRSAPPPLPANYQDRMTAARSVAGQDPRQVAQVVRSWVAEDND